VNTSNPSFDPTDAPMWRGLAPLDARRRDAGPPTVPDRADSPATVPTDALHAAAWAGALAMTVHVFGSSLAAVLGFAILRAILGR
jgi:hypothetical protein